MGFFLPKRGSDIETQVDTDSDYKPHTREKTMTKDINDMTTDELTHEVEKILSPEHTSNHKLEAILEHEDFQGHDILREYLQFHADRYIETIDTQGISHTNVEDLIDEPFCDDDDLTIMEVISYLNHDCDWMIASYHMTQLIEATDYYSYI